MPKIYLICLIFTLYWLIGLPVCCKEGVYFEKCKYIGVYIEKYITLKLVNKKR